LAADALAEDEAAVDRAGRLGATGRVEVVTVPDLAEAALQGDQLLLGPEADGRGGVGPGVLGRAAQERGRVRLQLLVLPVTVVVYLIVEPALLKLSELRHRTHTARSPLVQHILGHYETTIWA